MLLRALQSPAPVAGGYLRPLRSEFALSWSRACCARTPSTSRALRCDRCPTPRALRHPGPTHERWRLGPGGLFGPPALVMIDGTRAPTLGLCFVGVACRLRHVASPPSQLMSYHDATTCLSQLSHTRGPLTTPPRLCMLLCSSGVEPSLCAAAQTEKGSVASSEPSACL